MNHDAIFILDLKGNAFETFRCYVIFHIGIFLFVSFSYASAQSYPTWTQVSNITITGPTMTRTNSQTAWNGGAISQEYSLGDGWIEFRFASSKYAQMGLSSYNTSSGPGFDYAIFIHINSYLYIREFGTLLPNVGKSKQVSVPYTPTDILRVERTGTTIRYKKNGNTFYTSAVPSSGALYADCSFNLYLSSIIVNDFELGLRWTGAVNQDWHNPGNWSANRIPTSGDHVTINACTTCPVLSNSADIGALNLNTGSSLNVGNHLLSVLHNVSIVNSQIISTHGEIQATDFNDVRGSTITGAIKLKKAAGSINNWYGGNYFSPEVQFINLSNQSWRLSTQSNNEVVTTAEN